MKGVKASRSGRVTEDSIEKSARASERVASEFAEGAIRMEDAVARASDQAMRASVRMIQNNAETIQHMLQSGARSAGRRTFDRSARPRHRLSW